MSDPFPFEGAPEMPEGRGYAMRGVGSTDVAIPPHALWDIVMDEERLAASIPGADTLRREDDGDERIYRADVGIGVGRVKGAYLVTARFADCVAPKRLTLFGGAAGPFGNSSGEGWVRFEARPDGTRVHYSYAILIKGLVAKVGGRLLDAAADALIAKFFSRLSKAVERAEAAAGVRDGR